MYDIISNGPPSGVAVGAATALLGLDKAGQNLYVTGPGGALLPVAPSTLGRNGLLAQTANVASVFVLTVPTTGDYEVSLYETASNTPTGATLPALTAVFTDPDSGASLTATIASAGSISALNAINQGSTIIRAKVGTTITLATTSYAAGSGTALAYNVHVRIVYLG